MTEKLAQLINIPGISPIVGPLPTKPGPGGGFRFENIGDILTLALQYLFPLAGIIMFLFIVYGGFQMLTSAGDPKKIEAAQKRITYAIIGFVLLIASYWITKIVEMIFSPNQPFF